MKQLNKAEVAIVGGGILGLAFALEARQQKSYCFERDSWARGDSVRNFGMIHPLGIRPGKSLESAANSQSLVGAWPKCQVLVQFLGFFARFRSKEEIVVLEECVSLQDRTSRGCVPDFKEL